MSTFGNFLRLWHSALLSILFQTKFHLARLWGRSEPLWDRSEPREPLKN
jgi:hypothetical protein